jgi:hypothetical protein
MPNIKFHGAFVFRDQGNGILSGTYINPDDGKPYPETAILQSNAGTNLFEGVYETVWIEKSNHYKVLLEINLTSPGNYKLKWTDINPASLSHQGLGFLENNTLVGCYWK